jgi:hypothetical protein
VRAIGAAIGDEAIQGGVGAEASDQPAAVGRGAELLHILTACGLDAAPCLAAAGLAAAELGVRGGGQPVAVEAGGAGNLPLHLTPVDRPSQLVRLRPIGYKVRIAAPPGGSDSLATGKAPRLASMRTGQEVAVEVLHGHHVLRRP